MSPEKDIKYKRSFYFSTLNRKKQYKTCNNPYTTKHAKLTNRKRRLKKTKLSERHVKKTCTKN